jgi:transglutaminase-like putative cysteine protease
MLYEIRHRTTYEYGSRVASARILTHLEPGDRSGQCVETSSVSTRPEPVESAAIVDFFGNATRSMRFVDLPPKLVIDATARVRMLPRPEPEPSDGPDWPVVGAMAAAIPDLGRSSPVHMIFPSRLAPLLPAAAAFVDPFLGTSRPILAVALDLMRRIHDEFVYDPEATDVSTPLAAMIALRRGVCQDFAHLMIAALRGHGLPAAYVSGYLRTTPPPGRERLVGADATHAWVEVWCGPAMGWVGFDPTNAVIAGPDHVVLAVGRDYADVAPVAGVATLSADHRVEVEVDVLPIQDRAGEATAGAMAETAAAG